MAVQLSPIHVKMIANQGLEVIRNQFVLANRVNNTFSEDFKKKGERVTTYTTGTVTANDKVEGQDVTLQDPSVSAVEIVLNKYKEASFFLSDLEAFKIGNSKDFVLNEYQKSQFEALGTAVENDLWTLVDSLSQTIGTAGTDISEATILEAYKRLGSANVPKTGRTLLLSVKDDAAALGIDRFTSADKYGVGKIADGALGRIHGFETFSSALAPVVSGTPDTTKNVAFHTSAFGLGVAPLPKEVQNSDSIIQETVNDPETGLGIRVTLSYSGTKLGWSFVSEILYGVAELRDSFGVRILT